MKSKKNVCERCGGFTNGKVLELKEVGGKNGEVSPCEKCGKAYWISDGKPVFIGGRVLYYKDKCWITYS